MVTSTRGGELLPARRTLFQIDVHGPGSGIGDSTARPMRASLPHEITMPTLEAFDAEFGLNRARDQSALPRFLPLAGLVLAAVGISAALLWGSVDRQVWHLLASRAIDGQQSPKTDDRDLKQQLDGLGGESETLETSNNELASAQQRMLNNISPLESDRSNFLQRYSTGSMQNWYDDWNSLFYRIAAVPSGESTGSPQPPGAARPVVQTPVMPRNN
jgi:hypothetical protein